MLPVLLRALEGSQSSTRLAVKVSTVPPVPVMKEHWQAVARTLTLTLAATVGVGVTLGSPPVAVAVAVAVAA